jgi:hypothetical protein
MSSMSTKDFMEQSVEIAKRAVDRARAISLAIDFYDKKTGITPEQVVQAANTFETYLRAEDALQAPVEKTEVNANTSA